MSIKLKQDLHYIINHTKSILCSLKNQTIFITGGTGFFGCWLLETFLYANDTLGLNLNVIVLSRNPDVFIKKVPRLALHSCVTLLKGDVLSFKYSSIKQVDIIIHAATEASAKLNTESPLKMLDTITLGTRNVLDFAVFAGVKKVLYISSGAVYGKQSETISHVDESCSGCPDFNESKSAYGLGKRYAEYLCLLYSKKYSLDIKIARCFAFVGPYLPLDRHFAIGNFILDGLLERNICINSDGSALRSYLYAADLVIWLVCLLDKAKTCEPYNVGSEQVFSILEIANLVAKCFENKVKVSLKKPAGIDLQNRYIPSVKKINKLAGLPRPISLEDSVLKTIRWYESQ